MQKLKRNANLVVIIAILFVTGLTFASAFRSQSNLLVPTVSADEDEEDRDEEEDDREDDSDNDRDEDEDREDEDENDNEDEDKDGEEEDEDERRIVQPRTSAQRLNVAQTGIQREDDEDEDEDENEDLEEINEDIADLNKDINKAEARINILALSGMSVDAFRNSLNEVRGLLVQAQSNPQGAESVLETAEHKLERLEKLVKMSLKDDDEDEESVEEATEEIGELKRDIIKIEARLSMASTRGIDVSAYQTILNDAKIMLAQAQAKLSAGLFIEAEALAELAGKKLDRIDDIFEDEDEDDEDDISKEYKNEVALFVHNLKELGEIEGGIGQQVNIVAQAQSDSQTKIDESIKEVEDRSGFTEFLIGPKYGSIAEIQTAIVENQTRIKVLSDLANQLTNPAVKQVLQDQVAILTQQNTNLQKFITESQDGFSMFGWLAKLFA